MALPASSEPQCDPAVQTIPKPFDAGGDIILRSKDQQDFHTFKIFFSATSPVFQDMFSLDSSGSIMPIIDLPEPTQTLLPFLTWVDPRCVPAWSELSDLQTVLAVADKYDMPVVHHKIGGALSRCNAIIENDPIKVYALAIRYDLHDLARVAAKASLSIPLEDRRNIPELRFIPAYALQSLNEYYYACRSEALALTRDFRWIGVPGFRRAAGESHSCPYVARPDGTWRKWFVDFMDHVERGFEKQPCSETVARVLAETEFACVYCAPTPRYQLRNWVPLFGDHVERAVSKVCNSSCPLLETY